MSNETIKTLEGKARLIRELQSLIAEAQNELESLRDEVKNLMGENEDVRVGEYHITWKPVTTTRIDTVALKKERPEIAEIFTRTTTARRFVIV